MKDYLRRTHPCGSDGTARAIDQSFPAVELSERNLGFAAGNNLGLRRAVKVVILANSDITTKDTKCTKGFKGEF